MKLVLLILAVALAIGAYLLFRRSPDGGAAEAPEKKIDHMKFTSKTETEERAGKLLPAQGSEDRRSLLKKPTLPKAGAASPPGTRPPTFFVLATAKDGRSFEKSPTRGLFTPDWYAASGDPWVRVRSQQDNSWIHLNFEDVPLAFVEIYIQWDLVGMLAEGAPPLSQETLERYISEVTEKLGDSAEIRLSGPPDLAAKQASELRKLQEACDREAMIVLEAPAGKSFQGRDIWDVMLSLGIPWGDFDLFNWENESEIGPSYHFSVSTSTEPGYFLPEEMAADRLATKDLVFGFTIPSSGNPLEVFEAMAQAAEYARTRLGGNLIDKKGAPLNLENERAEILSIERQLEAAGLQAGTSNSVPFGSHHVKVDMYRANRQFGREAMRVPR